MPVIIANSAKEFKKVLKYEKVLVKFEANWSMPCKATVRAFEEISKLYKDVKAVSLDIDGAGVQDLLRRYEVRFVPAFLYFDKRKLVRRLDGIRTKAELRRIFDKE